MSFQNCINCIAHGQNHLKFDRKMFKNATITEIQVQKKKNTFTDQSAITNKFRRLINQISNKY